MPSLSPKIPLLDKGCLWPQHEWLKAQGAAPDTPLDNVVISRMRRFAAMNKLKKAALLVVARSMNQEQIQGLKELFVAIDADSSGTITVEELRQALGGMGNRVTVRPFCSPKSLDRSSGFICTDVHPYGLGLRASEYEGGMPNLGWQVDEQGVANFLMQGTKA